MLHRRILILAAASLAFTPATAFAASATQDAYAPDDTGVNAETDDSPAPAADTPTAAAAPTATGTSSLPFTGMEAGLIAAVGLGLAGTGVAMRRAGREQQ